MPELPDVTVYLEALAARVLGTTLRRIRLASPFVLRSVTPPPSDLEGLKVVGLRRIGKRLVLAFERDRFLVIHLMIAGRLRWRLAGAPVPKKLGLAALDFDAGTVLFTEAGTRKRASLVVVEGEAALAALDPGGIDVMTGALDRFQSALTRESHTLKRALTDPRLFSGIGNAYSDEILHHARLSPMKLTRSLDAAEVARLWTSTREVLATWTDRLRAEAGAQFPEHVTAFRPEMSAHGKFGQPCPRCGTPIQRIAYADNECNYCPSCQTGGRLLADRSLSRLLKEDWPRSLDELEQYKSERRVP